MNLAEYLQETGMPINEFARRAGLSSPTIHSLLKYRDVKLSVAILVELATKGRVKPQDLVDMDYILGKDRKRKKVAK
jgi:predicted transcriptional regulator